MPDFYPEINPHAIVIRRETRQRQENLNDVEDLRNSIRVMGLINPIVVREVEGEVILVAGERRLRATLDLGLESVPIRYFNDLSEEEAEVLELEENIKRKELTWRDQVRAVGRIHLLYKKRNSNWRIEQTSESVSLHHSYVRKILHVFDVLDTGRISKAESIEQAYNILHRFSERKAESIVGDIIVEGAKLFGGALHTTSTNGISSAESLLSDDFTATRSVSVLDELTGEITTPPPVPSPTITKPIIPPDPIISVNFIEWAKTYTGPKFSLVHCDFPYGNYRGGDSKGSMSGVDTEDFYENTEAVYWPLVDALCQNLERIMSYSAHLVFWFNMNFYTETVLRLRKVGLMVHDHPLIWHKTGGPGGLGVVPGTAVTYPRRTYDTALLASRGNRPLAKPGMNSYAAPTVGNKIHPSQKPEPMLRFFLSMLVDETTSMLDPTCGSGAALRAAEDLGAKSILGLELDPDYAKSANTRTLQARVQRLGGKLMRDEELL